MAAQRDLSDNPERTAACLIEFVRGLSISATVLLLDTINVIRHPPFRILQANTSTISDKGVCFQMALPKRRTSKPLHDFSVEPFDEKSNAGLLNLICVANILPAEGQLPTFPTQKSLQDNLYEEWDDAWKTREFAKFLDENFPRDRFDKFRAYLDLGKDEPLRPW